MITLLRGEWVKLTRRFVPYLSYLAILFVLALMVYGFHRNGQMVRRMGRASSGEFQTVGDPMNAGMLCHFALESVALLLLPILIPAVIGMIIGSEGAEGTLRTMLVRPRTRASLFCAKWLISLGYTFSLCFFVFVTSYGLGRLFFGGGQVMNMAAVQSGKMIVMTEAEALRYFTLAFSMLTVTTFVLGSLALCLGCFVDSGLAPGFAALAIFLVVKIVEVLPFEWIEPYRPYLFTTYLGGYRDAFPRDFDPDTFALMLPTKEILTTLRACGIYIGLFSLLGLWRFCRRDVTC